MEQEIWDKNNLWVETYFDGFTEEDLNRVLTRAVRVKNEMYDVFLPYLRRFMAREGQVYISEADAERDLQRIMHQIFQILGVDDLKEYVRSVEQARKEGRHVIAHGGRNGNQE